MKTTMAGTIDKTRIPVISVSMRRPPSRSRSLADPAPPTWTRTVSLAPSWRRPWRPRVNHEKSAKSTAFTRTSDAGRVCRLVFRGERQPPAGPLRRYRCSFAAYLDQPKFFDRATQLAGWPQVTRSVLHVYASEAETRRRLRERGLPRDRAKLSSWDEFWPKWGHSNITWTGIRVLELD